MSTTNATIVDEEHEQLLGIPYWPAVYALIGTGICFVFSCLCIAMCCVKARKRKMRRAQIIRGDGREGDLKGLSNLGNLDSDSPRASKVYNSSNAQPRETDMGFDRKLHSILAQDDVLGSANRYSDSDSDDTLRYGGMDKYLDYYQDEEVSSHLTEISGPSFASPIRNTVVERVSIRGMSPSPGRPTAVFRSPKSPRTLDYDGEVYLDDVGFEEEDAIVGAVASKENVGEVFARIWDDGRDEWGTHATSPLRRSRPY